jgi:hypothetical protein
MYGIAANTPFIEAIENHYVEVLIAMYLTFIGDDWRFYKEYCPFVHYEGRFARFNQDFLQVYFFILLFSISLFIFINCIFVTFYY